MFTDTTLKKIDSDTWFLNRPDTVLEDYKTFIGSIRQFVNKAGSYTISDVENFLLKNKIGHRAFFFFCLAINIYLKKGLKHRQLVKRLLQKAIRMNKSDHISRLFLKNLKSSIESMDLYDSAGRPYSRVISLKEWKKIHDKIELIVKRHVKADNDAFSFLDIGCADGILTSRILKAVLGRFRIKSLAVDLVEPSIRQLNAAVGFLRKGFKVKKEINKYGISIANFDFKSKQYDLVNASLSIHHLSSREKDALIKSVSSHSKYFLLTEFNINHQDFDEGDPRHLASLYYGYNPYLEGIYIQAKKNKKLFLHMIKRFVWNDIKDIMLSKKDRRMEKEILLRGWLLLIKKYAPNARVVFLGKNLAIGKNKNYSLLIDFSAGR